MGDLKGALAVRFNFPLQSFSSTLFSKVGLPLPDSLFLRNRGDLENAHQLYCFAIEVGFGANAWQHCQFRGGIGRPTQERHSFN